MPSKKKELVGEINAQISLDNDQDRFKNKYENRLSEFYDELKKKEERQISSSEYSFPALFQDLKPKEGTATK